MKAEEGKQNKKEIRGEKVLAPSPKAEATILVPVKLIEKANSQIRPGPEEKEEREKEGKDERKEKKNKRYIFLYFFSFIFHCLYFKTKEQIRKGQS